MDMIVAGGSFAKLAYIISDEYEAIGHAVMSQLGRGVTVLEGTGMYNRQTEKNADVRGRPETDQQR